MRCIIENENKLTISGRGLTITPTAGGVIIEQPGESKQAGLFEGPKKETRGRKPKMQAGDVTPTGAVVGPPDGDSDRVR